MLHSKVYLFEMPGGTAVAFIGSHNLTGFALNGLNGKASVMLEGSMANPEFQEIKRHIDHAKSQAVPYAPSMKEAYTWWMTQFVDGLRSKVNDKPRDTEARKTVIILAEEGSDGTPSDGETVYFELPEALRRVGSLNAEVHIYIFDKPIASPVHGFSMLHTAKKTLWCKTQGLELDQGGQELLADWQVLPRGHDSLKRTPRPFRPRPAKGMHQVRAEVYNEVFSRYEYLFDEDKQTWIPDLDRGEHCSGAK